MAFTFAIDPSSKLTLHEQLYRIVRAAIVAGRLRPGECLPSTRAIALQLNIARNTVATAFEKLAGEGYLRTRRGARAVVAETGAEEAVVATPLAPAPHDRAEARLSRRGEAIVSARTPFATKPGGRAFRLGLPALDAFPAEAWERALRQRWKRSSARLLADGDRRGYLPLREAISDYVSVARGVPSHAGRVIIVAGAQQGFSIIAQLLLDPGDAVWVEDPGYSASLAAMVAAGAVAVPMPVDEHGADPGPAYARAPNARLAIVTPANQFPLGVTMSPDRRRELLAWACRAKAWVVEDDYDGEFRYGDKPLPALAASLPERVIYVGTFSKVLMPSLRLGYLVVPDTLVDPVLAAKEIVANRTPPLEQAVTCDFITSGELLRHVRRMRILYAKRCGSLARVVAEELGDAARLRPPRAGMQAILEVPGCAADIASRAAAVGVHVTPLSAFAVEGRPTESLVLGFAAVPPPEQRRALRLLAGVLDVP